MKFIISIFLGGVVSFGLLAIMASLVATEDIYIEEVEDWAIITIINEPVDTKVVHKKRVLEPPPEPVRRPDGLINVSSQENIPVSTPVQIDVNVPSVEYQEGYDSQEFLLTGVNDADAVPIYRSLPRFPKGAVDEKISGWVKVQFSINRQGRVEDAEVLDAEPADIFNEAAIEALSSWKYKPKVFKGKTVKQTGLSVRIDFGKKQPR